MSSDDDKNPFRDDFWKEKVFKPINEVVIDPIQNAYWNVVDDDRSPDNAAERAEAQRAAEQQAFEQEQAAIQQEMNNMKQQRQATEAKGVLEGALLDGGEGSTSTGISDEERIKRNRNLGTHGA